MRTLIIVRIEAELLQAVREKARQENRTLTNFIETVLPSKVVRSAPSRPVLRTERNPGPPDGL